jgi:hypothetical protein
MVRWLAWSIWFGSPMLSGGLIWRIMRGLSESTARVGKRLGFGEDGGRAQVTGLPNGGAATRCGEGMRYKLLDADEGQYYLWLINWASKGPLSKPYCPSI